MSADIGILHFIGFLGGIQALVIAVLVGTVAGPRGRLFATLVGALGLAMGIITLSHTPAGRSMPWLYPAEVAVSLAAPPIFYVWVRLVVRGETRKRGWRWLHFTVPVLWIAVAAVLLAAGVRIGERSVPIEAVIAFQMIYTGFAAWRAFGEGGDETAHEQELRLARVTVVLFTAIHAAQVVRLISDASALRSVVPVTGAGVVFTLTGLAVRQSRLFASPERRREAKYEGSTLTEAGAKRGLERLRAAMEDGRLFLRPELTLGDLAEEVGLPRTHVSQIVNERMGKSFPELLAEYRVEEAKRILVDSDLDHLTVESVGYRAGFNSRSAFYDAFKRTTGVTPAAYREESRRSPV